MTFRAAATVTGIGSLPMVDADRAVAFVVAHAPQVPFWPQLPRRCAAEGMVRQALGVDPSLLEEGTAGRLSVRPGAEQAFADQLRDRDPALRRDEAVGFAAFVRALRHGELPAASAVKGQIAGPLTVGWALSAGGQPIAAQPELFDAVVHRIAARAAWQTRMLASAGTPVLISVDEPALGQDGLRMGEAVAVVFAAIRSEGGLAGLHSCATATEDLPVGGADVVSLDLHGRGNVLPPATGRAWAGGAVLAAGLVPTLADAGDLPAAAAVVAGWTAAASVTGDLRDLAARTLLSAACGLAGVGEAAASASFRIATEAGLQIRTHLEG